MQPFNAPAVLARVAAAGGPELVAVRPLPGGDVGAWLVRWPDGHEGVFTWAPPPAPAYAERLTRAVELVGIARAAGSPAPAYEAVFPLGAPAQQRPGLLLARAARC